MLSRRLNPLYISAVAILMVTAAVFSTPFSAFAKADHNDNTVCELTENQVLDLHPSKIHADWSRAEQGVAILTNDTNCRFPVSVWVFSLHKPNREARNSSSTFGHTDVHMVKPHERVVIKAETPNKCNFQIDFFYGADHHPGRGIAGHQVTNAPKGFCPEFEPTPTPTPTSKPTPTPVVITKSKGLQVQKTDNLDVTRPGYTSTYVISVKNIGDVELHDIRVVDTLPSKLTFVSAENGGSWDGNRVIWTGIDLAPNESITLRFKAKVKDDAPNKYVLHNVVVADSEDHDLRDEAEDVTVVERPGQIAAVVSVPVTAKTGATGIAGAISALLGSGGLAVVARRRFW